MVLKKLFTLILILFSSLIFAQQNIEFVHSDNFETNYFYSENPEITNRIYIGSDAFRFLNEEQIQRCAEFLIKYLEKTNLTFDPKFERPSENILSFRINTTVETVVSKLSPIWKSNFEREWTFMIFDLLEDKLLEKIDVFKSAKEGVFYNILHYEKRNKLSEYNVISRTNFALILNDKSLFKFLDNRNVFTRNFRSTNTLGHTQAIQVNNQESEIIVAFPFVNKKSKISDCLALNIIKEAVRFDEEADLKYGVNQVVMMIKNKEAVSSANLKPVITSENFGNLKTEAMSKMRASVGLNNLFFYSKYDLDAMERQIDSFRYEHLQKFISDLNASTYIIAINKERVEFDSLNLISFNTKIFENPILFKNNSSKLSDKTDSLQIEKIALFLALNPSVSININCTTNSSEINKVEKTKMNELIAKNSQNKSDYVVSRKTNLSLLRAIIIYNTLIEHGIDKNRMRCNGINGVDFLPAASVFIAD